MGRVRGVGATLWGDGSGDSGDGAEGNGGGAAEVSIGSRDSD